MNIFLAKPYTTMFDTYCLSKKPLDKYNTFKEAQFACDGSRSCNMFYKHLNETYYTCPLGSLPLGMEGHIVYIKGNC